MSDPDNLNIQRAAWAAAAIETFRARTGTDDCDALADLLCDLMHLCAARGHAKGWQFSSALVRASDYYAAEIGQA
jgi:hypothetical protein